MFFAALFATYFDLRANAAHWPPAGIHPDVTEATIGLVLLLISSIVMVFATRAMDRGNDTAARWWTAMAILAAVTFIGLSLNGYAHDPFTIATNSYGSIYYALTGFHLLHVTAGVGILLALLIGMRSPALRAYNRQAAEAMTYYWHFVFLVWIGIWSTVFLLQ